MAEAAGPVFLTGATGFIGGRLAEALHARGRRLRCLVREGSRAEALRQLGAELVPGDVTDRAALARGLAGAEVAYHLAARYEVGAVDARALERTNVHGTAAFLEAVKQAGTRRVVYVSTTVALGPAEAGRGTDAPRRRRRFPTVYHRTKTKAHQLAESAQAAGVPVIIVCPAFVYGPGDRGPGGRFLEDLLQGRLPALTRDPAWFSFVHVDDVAAGLVAVGERGTIGRTYVLGGEPASINEFAERAAEYAGVRAPRLRIPRALALFAGRVCDVASRLSGKRLPLSAEGVRSSTRDRWLHSYERTATELEWHPRPLEVGLPATVAHMRKEVS